MPRVKRGTRAVQRRKKVLKQAKGYFGARSKLYRIAAEAVNRALRYAYRDRRTRKRDFRRLWIVRINAAARNCGLSYSQLMDGLKKEGIGLNRKVLAELALSDPTAFKELAERARAAS